MTDSLTALKHNLEAKARMAEGYERSIKDKELITLWADRYCEAKDAGDEVSKDIYFSALMLKFWNQIQIMYEKSKTAGLPYEDYSEVLAKCILVALDYRSWQDPSKKTTAQACIYQVIASRGAPEIMYESNRDTNKANVNTASFDQKLGASDEDADTLLDLTEDADENPEVTKSDFAVRLLVQKYINMNKIEEAIMFDTIAYEDTMRETKETVVCKDEEGNEVKYPRSKYELWEYKTVQILMSLDERYKQRFLDKYEINENVLNATIENISKKTSTKLYKDLRMTLERARTSAAAERLL